MSKKLVWLHFSDLHYCEPKTGLDSTRVLRTLAEDLGDLQQAEGLRPDLIFFTGDAAFGHLGDAPGQSIASQFEKAAGFFEGVRRTFRKPPSKSNVFIVPGNHDVNRKHILRIHTEWLENKSRTAQEISDCFQEGGEQLKEFMKRLSEFRAFLEGDYGHLLTDPDRLVYALVRRVNGIKVGIAGLNTAWSCGGDQERGKLHCGDWQVKRLYEILLEKKADFRIALMHHPATWLSDREEPDIGRQIERDFHFTLHGHEHKEWVSHINEQHIRIAAGACYTGSQDDNGYNFVRLDFDTGDVEVWLRKYHPTGGRWGPEVIPGRTDAKGIWRLTFNIPTKPTGGRLSPAGNEVRRHIDTALGTSLIPVSNEAQASLDAIHPPLTEGAADDLRTISDTLRFTAIDYLSIRCKNHVMYADIVFPSGDLVLREIIEGLVWTGPGIIRELPLLSFASRVWPEGVILAKSLTHPYTVKMHTRKNVRLTDTQEGPIYAYMVEFDNPLANGHVPITLVFQRAWFGVMYSSVEDKRRHDVNEDREHFDQYLKRVRWSCDRLAVHVRCWPHDWPHLSLSPTVLDDKGRETDAELSSGRVVTSVWTPPVDEPYHLPFVSSSEVVITVDEPRCGYSYGFRWPLPLSDAKPPPPWVSHLIDYFGDLLKYPTIAKRLDNLLQDIVVSTLALIQASGPESLRQPEQIHSYFFSPNPSSGSLTCRASTAPPADFLRNHTIRWGEDVIGTASRRRHSVFFSGARGNVREFPASSTEFLARIRALLTYPIMPEEDYVVGIIAVASFYPTDSSASREPSLLADLAANTRFCNRWANEVLPVWRRHFNAPRGLPGSL
jgi:predicted MPP superfamily phosphohydrolase